MAATAACLLPGVARAALPGRPATAPTLLPPALREQLVASGLAPEHYGLYAAPITGGAPLLAWQADQPFVLASTAKLVTSIAALELLGPDFRWRTEAHLTGPLRDGRLLGDLVIVGGGDATLSSVDVLAWMRRWRAEGLEEILGDIVLDRSRFRLSDDDHASTPTPAAERPHHVRPDALTLDGGTVQVSVQAGRRGQPRLEVTPPMGGALRQVNAVTRQGGCSAVAQWRERAGTEELHVSGAWSADCPARPLQIAPLNPAELSRRAVAELWRQAGGRLQGRVRELPQPGASTPWHPADPAGQAPPPWSEHRSATLAELLRGMNKVSHNLIARHLMLSLAPDFPSRPATLAGAQARVRQWLAARGLPAERLAVDSGSGLSRAERGSPRALTDLLRLTAQGPHARGLLTSLPVAGIDGTLEHRLHGGAAQGQAWLKTGTLLDARALAGYVRTRGGRQLAVALLANDPYPEAAARATPVLDACVEWLARHA